GGTTAEPASLAVPSRRTVRACPRSVPTRRVTRPLPHYGRLRLAGQDESDRLGLCRRARKSTLGRGRNAYHGTCAVAPDPCAGGKARRTGCGGRTCLERHFRSRGGYQLSHCLLTRA